MPNILFSICRNTIAISCGDCQEEPKKEDDVKDVKDVDDVNPQDNEIITIMRPSEMPIYCETCQISPPKHSPYEEIFHVIRKEIHKIKKDYHEVKNQVKNTAKDNFGTISEVVSDNISCGLEILHQEDSENIRYGVIGASAFTGFLLAGGGKIRRIFGSLVLGGAATAVCYPQESLEATKNAWRMYQEYQPNKPTDSNNDGYED